MGPRKCKGRFPLPCPPWSSFAWMVQEVLVRCLRTFKDVYENDAESITKLIRQEKTSAEIRGEFFRTKSRVNFAGGFLVEFFRAFFLGKKEGKLHGKIQIGIWELRGQNLHWRDPALIIPQTISCVTEVITQIKFISQEICLYNQLAIARLDYTQEHPLHHTN